MNKIDPKNAWALLRERTTAAENNPPDPYGEPVMSVLEAALFILDLNDRLVALEAAPQIRVTAHRSGFPPAPFDLNDQLMKILASSTADPLELTKLGVA